MLEKMSKYIFINIKINVIPIDNKVVNNVSINALFKPFSIM